MIGWLEGVLKDKRPPHLLLDVRGVGYELEAPMTTFYALPGVGEPITLYTHQIVREDANQLYGFITERDRNVFRMLLKVNGVGAKLALGILSGMDTVTLARCILEADTISLVKLPGIGKKTAERLVLDLRDRFELLPPAQAAAPGNSAPLPRSAADPSAEAVDALVALGLKAQEASRRVRSVYAEGLETEEIIRQALQSMVK